MFQKTIKYFRRYPINLKKNDYHLFKREISRKLDVNKKILNINFLKVQRNGYIFQIFKFSDYFIPKDEIKIYGIKKFFLIIKIFIYSIFNFNKTKKINKEIFFVHDFRSHGYYHFLNDIGQKLELLKEIYPNKKITIYFPNVINFEWVKIICKIYNYSFYYHKIEKNILFSNARLVCPISLSGNPEENMFRKMNKRFVKYLSPTNSSCSKKIYISRKYSRNRNLLNENKLVNFLKKNKYEIYYFEKLSFYEQLRILKKTNTIVGPHGAGLINMLWLKPGSNIVEIRGEDDDWNNCYFASASALKHNYKYILAKTKKSFFQRHIIKKYLINIRGLNNISEIF